MAQECGHMGDKWTQGRQVNSAFTQMYFVCIPGSQELPRPPTLPVLLRAVHRAAKLLLVSLYEVAMFQEMR